MRRRTLLAAVALGLTTISSASWSQTPPPPFSIDDMLAQEDVGGVRISPDGRWIVIERQAAWNSASTYRYGMQTPWMLSSLVLVPARGDGPAIDVGDRREGLVAGPFSPDGRRMAVYGLSGRGLRLGVLTLADGAIRWLPVTPETPRFGRTLAWRSDTSLITLVRPDDSLPILLRFGLQLQDRHRELWEAAAHGGISSIYIPSGEDRDQRDQAIPLQLVEIDVDTGRSEVLTRGEFFDLELSPDGRTLAALRDAEDIQDGSGAPAFQGEPTRRRRLVLVDLIGSEVIEPLPDRDFIAHLLTWNATGERLLAFARADGEAFEAGRFWSVRRDGRAETVPTGAAAPWVDRTPVTNYPVVYGGWAGRRPVVQVRSSADERLWLAGSAWMSANPGDAIIAGADGPAVRRADGLYSFPDGRRLVEGRPTDPGTLSDGGLRATLNPTGDLGGEVVVAPTGCLASPGASAPTPLCPPPTGPREILLAVGADAGVVIGSRRSEGGARTIFRFGADGSRTLVEINRRLEQVGWGEVREIRHDGADGRPLSSWLLLPPAGVRQGPPPVVVYLYPGRSYRSAPAWLLPGGDRRHLNAALLASAGYAVLVPSLPEPSSGVRDRGDLARRLLAIVDAAGAEADIDTGRVALAGHSFGAYGALLAATQSDRFSAVIATNGYADLSTSTELPPPWRISPEDGVPIRAVAAWAETGQAGLGVPFPLAPGDYVARSPLYSAAGLHAPTLLIESDLDHNRFGAMFSALYRLDRNAALLTYYGESHALMSPGNLRDMHARILAWLERWLEPGPGRQAGLPSAGPALQDGQDQKAVGGGIPDQSFVREAGD